jgi:hypothetical protein
MSEKERSAVERLFSELSGRPLKGFDKEGVFRCDYCSSVIHPTKRGRDAPDERVTHYLTDDLLNDSPIAHLSRNPFFIIRTYCPDCNRTNVQWPCEGWHEMIVSSYFRPDGSIDDFEIEDFSASDDGEPWTPADVWEAVFQIQTPNVTFDEWMKLHIARDSIERKVSNPERPPIAFGPEDIVDSLRIWQVDPREITDKNGNIKMSESKRAAISNRLDERSEELAPVLENEEKWSDKISSESQSYKR